MSVPISYRGRIGNLTTRWTIGDTTLTAVVEAETHGIPVGLFYPEATADDVAAAGSWLPDGTARPDGSITFRVQAFVLDHAGMTIVVDPCVGNGKHLALPFWNELDLPWLGDFAAAGYDAASVDLVIHTHLHEDHLGWDTHLVEGEWVPTFPNARHVYVGVELEWAASEERRQGQDPFAESISPVLDAGLGWEVTPGTNLGHGLSLVSTPGHTPGHVALTVATSAEPLVITGDLVHHPFQLASPDVAELGDVAPDLARSTRKEFFAEHARSGAVIAGTHFPVEPVGRIQSLDSGWKFAIIPGETVDRPQQT